MTGNDFLQFASNLAVNPGLGSAAPRCRTAVSRAYYAAFHSAVEFLAEFGMHVPANHTGHQETSRQLHRTKQPEAQMAARLLEDLRTDRNEADYRLDRQRLETQKCAKDAVESASELHRFLDACRLEPARSEIAEALSTP
jgi:uncharacterized protein (UPF0332 family)